MVSLIDNMFRNLWLNIIILLHIRYICDPETKLIDSISLKYEFPKFP